MNPKKTVRISEMPTPQYNGDQTFNADSNPGMGPSPYPGVNYPYSEEFGQNNVGSNNFPVPYTNTPTTSTPSKNPLSGLNFDTIRSTVERFGGVDGILSGVTKAQKIMQSLQQMGPMLKLLMGSFATKSVKNSTRRKSNRKRRKNRRRNSSSYRKPSANNRPKSKAKNRTRNRKKRYY